MQTQKPQFHSDSTVTTFDGVKEECLDNLGQSPKLHTEAQVVSATACKTAMLQLMALYFDILLTGGIIQ
jgi:hypothetical protein